MNNPRCSRHACAISKKEKNMKRMIRLRCLILAMLFAAIGIHAQDISPSDPFDGFYIGSSVGYLDGEAIHRFSTAEPSGDSNPHGLIGGVFAGYQKTMQNILIGIEADYEHPDADGDYINNAGLTSGGAIDLNFMASLRMRVGYPLKKIGLMPYLTGGIAYCDADLEGGPASDPDGGYFSESFTGWIAGAGLEKSITEHLVARIEYRCADYGDVEDFQTPGWPLDRMSVDLKTQTILLGIYYRF
jgi:outer membrane immunogenic protein